jgi:hypothetical protein
LLLSISGGASFSDVCITLFTAFRKRPNEVEQGNKVGKYVFENYLKEN